MPPRSDKILCLQCALTALVGSSVTINWFHNGTSQISNGGSELQTETNNLNGTNTFRSILSLTDPQPASDSGEYYCQATVDGVDLLPSESFRLTGDEHTYTNNVECGGLPPYYSIATKCADQTPSESIPLPTTSPTIHTKTDNSNFLPSTHGQGIITIRVWIYILACVNGVFGVTIVILVASIRILILRKKTQSK